MKEQGMRRTETVARTAKILGIAKSTAYRAVRAGEIPSVRIGGRWLVLKSGLDALLQDNRQTGISASSAGSEKKK